MSALQWHTVANGRRKTADGRYAGWSYEIEKFANGIWDARFYDGSDALPQKLVVGTFAQARKAANAHHNHPGA